MVELTSLYSNPNMGRTTDELSRLRRGALDTRRPPETNPRMRRHIRKISDQDRSQIIANYRSGGTIRGVAREYGIARQTVRRIVG